MTSLITDIDNYGKCKLKIKDNNQSMKFKFENADDIFSTAINLLRYALMANFHENPRPFTYSNNVESAINEYIDNIQNEIYSDSMLYDYIKDNIENNNDEESEDNEKEFENNEK